MCGCLFAGFEGVYLIYLPELHAVTVQMAQTGVAKSKKKLGLC